MSSIGTAHDLVPATIAAAFICGLVVALLGSLKLPLSKRLSLDDARIGALLGAMNLAIIPLMAASGGCVDRLGVRMVLIGGSGLTALSLAGLGFAGTARAAMLWLLTAGLGACCLGTGATVLMPRAFFEENAAASLNLGYVFLGLGALATPALADVLFRGMGLRTTLSLLAAVSLMPAVAALAAPAGSYEETGAPGGSFLTVLDNRLLWICAAVYFLYLPLEAVIGGWTAAYLGDLGCSTKRCALYLSGCWLVFVAARLVAAFVQQREILPRESQAWLIVALALAAAVVLGNVAGTRARGPAGTGLLIIAALLGPIFPTLVGVLFDSADPGTHGRAYGLMYAIGSTAGLVLPAALNAYRKRTSTRTAFRIPMLLSLLAAGVAIVVALST